MNDWQPIETAPKGGGEEMVTDPKYMEPPNILLKFECGNFSVAHWDWYYAEGGSGHNGMSAWVEPCSGEQLDLHYVKAVGWKPLDG